MLEIPDLKHGYSSLLQDVGTNAKVVIKEASTGKGGQCAHPYKAGGVDLVLT